MLEPVRNLQFRSILAKFARFLSEILDLAPLNLRFRPQNAQIYFKIVTKARL